MTTWNPKPTRTTADPASAADANLDQSNLDALKGGVQATPPPRTLVDLDTDLAAVEIGSKKGWTSQTLSGTLTMTVAYTRGQKIIVNGADRIVKLPTTTVLKGYEYEIVNPSPTYYTDVQGATSGTVWKFWEGSIVVQANQDTPTTAAHWDIVSRYTAPVRVLLTGGTGAYTADAAIDFATESEDTHSAFNMSTYIFTAPKDGYYRVTSSGYYIATGSAFHLYWASSAGDVTEHTTISEGAVSGIRSGVSAFFKMLKGDSASFRAGTGWTSAGRKRASIILESY